VDDPAIRQAHRKDELGLPKEVGQEVVQMEKTVTMQAMLTKHIDGDLIDELRAAAQEVFNEMRRRDT